MVFWIPEYTYLTWWPLGDATFIFKTYFLNSLHRIIMWTFAVHLLSCECHRTSLMRSQHWFRQWLGAIRQQAIIWANLDPDLYPHMASLGHTELKFEIYAYGSHWVATQMVLCITGNSIVFSTACTVWHQRKHQSSAPPTPTPTPFVNAKHCWHHFPPYRSSNMERVSMLWHLHDALCYPINLGSD